MEFVDIRRACFPVYSVAMEISIFTRHSAQHESYCRLGRLPLELSPVIGSLTRAACLFQAGLDFERSAIFISSSVRTRETGEEKTTTTWFNVLSELEHKRGMKFIVLRIKTINMSLFDSNPHNSSFTGGKKRCLSEWQPHHSLSLHICHTVKMNGDWSCHSAWTKKMKAIQVLNNRSKNSLFQFSFHLCALLWFWLKGINANTMWNKNVILKFVPQTKATQLLSQS